MCSDCNGPGNRAVRVFGLGVRCEVSSLPYRLAFFGGAGSIRLPISGGGFTDNFNKNGTSMNRVLKLLGASTFAIIFAGPAVAEGEAPAVTPLESLPAEVRTVEAGSAIYQWAAGSLARHRVAKRLRVELIYPADFELAGDASRSPLEMLSESKMAGVEAPAKGILDYNEPLEPDGPGSSMGTTQTTTRNCARVGMSGGSGQWYADITYTWEYEYTTDTDGNGENDADPEWVLRSSSAKLITESSSLQNCFGA
jgi:hypothetical protein